MPRRFSYAPEWEPYRHVVKVRVTSTQLNYLNSMAARLAVSRSYLFREALQLGLPRLLDDRRRLQEAGMAAGPAGRATPEPVARRGPRAATPVAEWIDLPDRPAPSGGGLELPEGEED